MSHHATFFKRLLEIISVDLVVKYKSDKIGKIVVAIYKKLGDDLA